MTLKKLFLAAMASVLVSTGMQAQVENFEIFRHVGGNLNVGTEGIGFDVATPVTDYLEVSAGICQFMGHMKVYQDDQELNIDDLRDKATDDLSKLIDKWTVYPVFKLAVTGRFL